MKFLLVDDNPGARRLLRLILGNSSNEYAECSDGNKAAEMYAEFHPDFVMMDIKMKEMNGLVATEEILSKYPNAKIFIVSDYDQFEFVEEAEKIGALKLVSKENLTVLPELIEQYK